MISGSSNDHQYHAELKEDIRNYLCRPTDDQEQSRDYDDHSGLFNHMFLALFGKGIEDSQTETEEYMEYTNRNREDQHGNYRLNPVPGDTERWSGDGSSPLFHRNSRRTPRR